MPYSSARNAANTQTACAPPAPRWRAYRQAQHLPQYQIPPPRLTLYRAAQLPYYNNVYKGAAVRPCYRSMPDSAAYRRPCQPGGVSVSTCTGSARRLAVWHRVNPAHSTQRGNPAARGAEGGAEPLTATAVSLFGLSPDNQ